jgi:voltage-gated potassium channel Kch
MSVLHDAAPLAGGFVVCPLGVGGSRVAPALHAQVIIVILLDSCAGSFQGFKTFRTAGDVAVITSLGYHICSLQCDQTIKIRSAIIMWVTTMAS